MEVNYKGEALEIGFNVSYLLMYLTLWSRDIKMTLLNSTVVLIEASLMRVLSMLSPDGRKVKGIILAI